MWQKRASLIVALLTCLVVITVGMPFVQHLRQQARKVQSTNLLKQIGLALYNYESTFNSFPPGGVFDSEGRGYHGWMTLILPYMEDSPFYNSVNFHQPWDSVENAGLFLNPMPCYESPDERPERRYWKFPVAHYSANAHLFSINSCARQQDFGENSQMFLVGELSDDFIPWGCPYNFRELTSINSTPATYGRHDKVGCLFLYTDVRVAFVSNDVTSDVLKAMSGDDMSGFHINKLKFDCPDQFPCPKETLWLSWTYKAGYIVKRNSQGTVVSQMEKRGK